MDELRTSYGMVGGAVVVNGGYYLFTDAQVAGTSKRRTRQELGQVFGQNAIFYKKTAATDLIGVPNLLTVSGQLPSLEQQLYMTALSRGIGFFVSKSLFFVSYDTVGCGIFNFHPHRSAVPTNRKPFTPPPLGYRVRERNVPTVSIPEFKGQFPS